MIPKIIHYCWFGTKKMPELAEKCLESWKKNCPDYKIVKWSEDNFNIDICDYVKEAFKNQKYAFVSDFVRLYALVHYGGIYMDTDVELIRPIDCFLSEQAFSGFESDTDIPTGIMGAEKEFPFFQKLIKEYETKHFEQPNGYLDLTANVKMITEICMKHGLIQNNRKQSIDGFVLYPKEYFCPKDWKTGMIDITENTYAIHHFAGSWCKKVSAALIAARIDEIKSYSKLYMYGAGEYAEKCIDILNTADIPLTGVVVTNLKTKRTFYGHKIIDIQSLTDYDSLILIAVSENHEKEIVYTLQSRGFKHYLYVCD